MTENTPRKPWYEVLASLTPLIIGIGVTGVGAFYTQVSNSRQLQLNQITALDKFRPLLTSENDADREFAYASFAALGYEGLALKIIQSKRDAAGRGVVEAIKESGSTSDRVEASAALNSIPARVYIHIGQDAQRSTAKALDETLRHMNFSVPGIERVGAVPDKTSVRYFNVEDRPAAESITAALRQGGISDAVTQQVTRYKVRPGSLEVWLSASVK